MENLNHIYLETFSTKGSHRGGYGMGFFGDPQTPIPNEDFYVNFHISGIILGDRGFFQIWAFLSLESGIFLNMGIFIPGIQDFFKSGDFHREFFKIWGFLSRRLGIFSNLGIFYSRDFLGMGIFIDSSRLRISGF